MRKKLIIGNWKMNLNMQEASLYLHKLMEVLKPRRDVEVVVAPTTLTLQSLSLQSIGELLSWQRRIAIGATMARTLAKCRQRIFGGLLTMYLSDIRSGDISLLKAIKILN